MSYKTTTVLHTQPRLVKLVSVVNESSNIIKAIKHNWSHFKLFLSFQENAKYDFSPPPPDLQCGKIVKWHKKKQLRIWEKNLEKERGICVATVYIIQS